MSADGRAIVGWSGTTNDNATAFIWTPDLGMVSLRQHLERKGVTGLDRWVRLTFANAISSDGKVIGGIGVARDVLGTPSWIATLD